MNKTRAITSRNVGTRDQNGEVTRLNKEDGKNVI